MFLAEELARKKQAEEQQKINESHRASSIEVEALLRHKLGNMHSEV